MSLGLHLQDMSSCGKLQNFPKWEAVRETRPLRCGPGTQCTGQGVNLSGRKTDRTCHLPVHLQNLTVGKRVHSAALLSFDLIHQRFVA